MEDIPKKIEFKKSGCLVIVVLLIFLLAIASCFEGDENESTIQPDVEVEIQPDVEVEKVTQIQPAEMTIDEYVPYLIKETVGEKTNMKEETLIEVGNDSGNLILDLFASENLTASMTRSSMHIASNDLFKKAFEDRNDINSLTLIWHLTLVDVKGNEKVDKVMTVMFTRENADTINWENILFDNIPKVADQYWVHPALSN